jgi:hypothetical protein
MLRTSAIVRGALQHMKLWFSETRLCVAILVVGAFTWLFTVTGPLTLAAATSGKSVGTFYVSIIRAALSNNNRAVTSSFDMPLYR